MSAVNVSIILPSVSDKSKFARFCSSLFASELNIELLVCEAVDDEMISSLSEAYAEKIKIINAIDRTQAVSTALNIAQGKFLMFSDVSVTFAPSAVERLIVASRGRAAAANVGLVSGTECNKAFRDGFSFDELSSCAVYFNHLISADVIKANSIGICSGDSLSLMLFLADYYRYDSCNTVNEVLIYSDIQAKYSSNESLVYLNQYANIFKVTGNTAATLFFTRAVFSALLPELNAESFEALKSVTAEFADDYLLLSWIKSTFDIDSFALTDAAAHYEAFKYNGTNVYYKEITLPVTSDRVVKNFYFGKFGIDVLKKCIGAWGYYKFYRRKDDFIKKFGCKLFKKLLGGDFDA